MTGQARNGTQERGADGGLARERRHDEIRMRNIYVGRRVSETVNEEQPDKLGKTVRFEQEAPNTSSSNHACLAVSSQKIFASDMNGQSQ